MNALIFSLSLSKRAPKAAGSPQVRPIRQWADAEEREGVDYVVRL